MVETFILKLSISLTMRCVVTTDHHADSHVNVYTDTHADIFMIKRD